MNQIEVLVAGTYVKRDDFDRTAHAIFAKLDKIADKIDAKADAYLTQAYNHLLLTDYYKDAISLI